MPGNILLAKADCMAKPNINGAGKYALSRWKKLQSYKAKSMDL